MKGIHTSTNILCAAGDDTGRGRDIQPSQGRPQNYFDQHSVDFSGGTESTPDPDNPKYNIQSHHPGKEKAINGEVTVAYFLDADRLMIKGLHKAY
jgi:hypothetical protein